MTALGQTSVNITQAPAIAGDFASTNPRHAALTVPGGYSAGVGGCTIGLFAWADATNTYLTNSANSGQPTAFIARTQSALITTYLSSYGNTIPAGFPVGNAFESGDFWAKNTGNGSVTVGQKAYAKLADGTIIFDATGQSHSGYVETKFIAKTAGATLELVKISSTPGL